MFPVGGIEVMLVGAVLSGLVCLVLGGLLGPRVGWITAWSLAGLLWSLAVIACLTLIPAEANPGVVSAESRMDTCSWDIGGPAPDGFWIFSGGQRLLNTVAFVPSGALLVLLASRWRAAVVILVPIGLALLAAYSAAIERTQLELARIDRACDVTDVVDNVTGAVLGVLLGGVLALVLRPWRARIA
ncbi:VanZ family protein [Nocardioides dongkuii]|uniref:VanZ family protein n=1 Tax=Nocardioides dongkuii TaxID=2760089 RepID=UPI0018775565|nr:VanZ family protein [Nocardioides dongkuii]